MAGEAIGILDTNGVFDRGIFGILVTDATIILSMELGLCKYC
jgi:hypothetical protein